MKREHLANFDVAGFTYYQGAACFKKLQVGTKLRLELEENNKYDPRAVAIYYKDLKLGFVPRAENRIFYKILAVGLTCLEVRVQRINPAANPEQQVQVVIHLVGQ